MVPHLPGSPQASHKHPLGDLLDICDRITDRTRMGLLARWRVLRLGGKCGGQGGHRRKNEGLRFTKQIPKEIAARINLPLKPIAELFAASRITIIVRSPEEGNTLGNLVLSNDNPTKIMEVLKEHMVAEAKRFAAEGKRSGTPGAEFPK